MAKTRELFAACRDGKLQIVQKLVESKKVYPTAAVDERCNDFTALHYASANGHLSIAQYLIDKCYCDVNAKDSYHGKTPLHYAAENGHISVVKYLVFMQDCIFNLKSNIGKTPLQYASDNGHGEVAAFLAEYSARKKHKKSVAPSNPKSPDKAGGTHLSEDNLPILLDQLGRYAAKWRMIGTYLGFHSSELDVIQCKPALSTGAPLSYLNELLVQWFQWAPQDSRGSKNIATLEALQTAISRAGLYKVAAELTVN